MKPNYIPHHDDPPCDARLTIARGGGRFCPECKLAPDTQSTRLHPYCTKCNIELEKMHCPKCGQLFEHAD